MMRRVLVVGALALLLAASAEARSIVLTGFDVTLDVRADGTVDVAETIRARFTGSWNGLLRTIPVRYETPEGLGYDLALDVLGATDANDSPLRLEESIEGHARQIRIWIPGANDATRTVTLRYRVGFAIAFFADHDELYWNATGTEWPFPILDASALVTLPEGATVLDASAWVGPHGSRERAGEIEVGEHEVSVRTGRELGIREGLTVVVGWTKGAVAEPGWVERTLFVLRSNWIFGVPLACLALMTFAWHRYGRDPRLRPIAVRYEPPEGLRPGEAGTLVDDSPDMRDVTATIVDLAVRGYLRIEETKTSGFLGLWSDRDYVFHLRRSKSEWQELHGHERAVLEGLFTSSFVPETGEPTVSVRLGDLRNRFYESLDGIRTHLFESLLGRGLYRVRPDHVKRAVFVVGIVVGVLVGATGMLPNVFGVTRFAATLAGLASGLVILAFAPIMPARTRAGARALEEIRGFEEFLERVESDRYARLVRTPEMFERFLPYAMAFGVENEWVQAFADIYTEPPDWYVGDLSGGFRPRAFVGSLDRMSAQAAAVLASRPRTSEGSALGGGSSGGGFSGGGFGGGGGGGF